MMLVKDKIAEICRRQTKPFTLKKIAIEADTGITNTKEVVKRFVRSGLLREKKIKRIWYFMWAKNERDRGTKSTTGNDDEGSGKTAA